MKLTNVRLAWRNLWRHPQRTALMIAIVAFGSWMILVVWGITDGFLTSMTGSQVNFDQGDFQLRAEGYADDPVPANGLTPTQVIQAEGALSDLRIEGAAPRLEVFGMLRSSYGTDGVLIRGVDPLREQLVTEIAETVVEGRLIASPGEVLLPAKLAESLDVRLGERVVVLAQGESGTNSQAFTAVGFFSVVLATLDNTVFISIEDARTLSEWDGLTAIAVNLPQGASTTRAVKQVAADLPEGSGIEVADYYALNPLAKLIIGGSAIKMIPFVLMISLLAGFGVANTAFYSVLERTREFGVMTAVGMSRKLLAQVVLLESVFVAAIGFVVGGGVGYGLLIYLGRYGIRFGDAFSNFGGSFGMPTVIYASTSGWYWVAAFSVVAFTALVAAWYPARRANRLEPVTAIREG
jgi:ABC-type lipoprotein release transport system permease subunit